MLHISGQQLKRKRNEKRKRHTQKNVEANFLRNFVVNNTVLYMFGGMRVNIRNRTIGPTTIGQNIYSFISILAMTSASALHMTRYSQKFGGKDWLVLITSDIGCVMQYSAFLTIRLIGKYTNKEKNVQIYYMLQNIDRILHVEHNIYYSNFVHTVLLTVGIVMLICFTTGYIIHSYFLIQALDTFYSMPFCFGMLTCYFDITLGVSMIVFLIIRTRHLNRYIKVTTLGEHYEKEIKTQRRSISKFILSLIIPNILLNDGILQQEKWLECLKLIINSHRVIVDIYSISILMNTIIVLVWSFVCVGIVVSGAQSGIFPQICSILYIVWAIVYYILLTVAAIYNDWFLGEIKRLKLTCVSIMLSGNTGQFYKTASEMFRAIHYAKLEFDVYGVFVFTSMIPLQLMGVVTSNMLVLVQFIIER